MSNERKVVQMVNSGWDYKEIVELFRESRKTEKMLVEKYKNKKLTMGDFL